jgi:muconolactone delta-isomerase
VGLEKLLWISMCFVPTRKENAMRLQANRAKSPMQRFQTRIKTFFGNLLPRSHPNGNRQPLNTSGQPLETKPPGPVSPGNNGSAREALYEGHFVQTEHRRRQLPTHLRTTPLDEETFTAIETEVYHQAKSLGGDWPELALWELRLAGRYALHFEVPAREALEVIVGNLPDLRYIADEVGFQMPKEEMKEVS